MSKVNWGSIVLKIRAAADDEAEEIIEDVVEKGAQQFVDILVDEMRSSGVPESVIADAASLSVYNEPDVYQFKSNKTGWYKKMRVDMELNFEDASRWSFNGFLLRNVVSLFDTGYKIRGKLPAGEWHGERVRARRSRPALHFMRSAMRRAKSEIEGLSRVYAAED